MSATRRVAMRRIGVVTVAFACGVGSDEATLSDGDAHPAHAGECGPDVVALHAAQDPETVTLYEASEREWGDRWLARKRCLADAGDAEAQLTMGVAYRDGSDGPPQDYALAAAWFARAAEQGHPMAQFNMGRLYEDGRGVTVDPILAHMWFNLAAAAFPLTSVTRSEAFGRRDRLAERMTPAELRLAQQMASEWWERSRAADRDGAPDSAGATFDGP